MFKVATAFGYDVQTAEAMARHVRTPYFRHTSPAALETTVIPPEMLPVGYQPSDRGRLSYRYALRRTVQRNHYETLMEREGVDYITMACDTDFPLLDSASNIEEGMAVLLLPSAGREAHQLHVLPLWPDGRVGLPGATSGTVHFTDGTQAADVVIPFDGSRVVVKTVLPPDTSF